MRTDSAVLNPGVQAREVWSWAGYDFANSGYTAVVLTAVFNAYFVGVVAARVTAPYAQALRDRIATAIRESGVTLRQLAATTGIPRSTLARSMRDGEFWLRDFQSICRALNIEPSSMLSDTPAPNLVEAGRLAETMCPLTEAERYAVRTLIESAVELRTAAIAEDRRIAGAGKRRGDG